MLPFRSTVAVLLVSASPFGLAGCGSSDEEEAARRANDAINTTAIEAESAKTKALEKANAKAAKKQAEDVDGIAGDVKKTIDDNVTSTVEDAKADARKKAADAQAAAKAAADEAVAAAQKEASKAQSSAADALEEVQKNLEDAQSDIEDATSKKP